jgi:hypothetical protein
LGVEAQLLSIAITTQKTGNRAFLIINISPINLSAFSLRSGGGKTSGWNKNLASEPAESPVWAKKEKQPSLFQSSVSFGQALAVFQAKALQNCIF